MNSGRQVARSPSHPAGSPFVPSRTRPELSSTAPSRNPRPKCLTSQASWYAQLFDLSRVFCAAMCPSSRPYSPCPFPHDRTPPSRICDNTAWPSAPGYSSSSQALFEVLRVDAGGTLRRSASPCDSPARRARGAHRLAHRGTIAELALVSEQDISTFRSTTVSMSIQRFGSAKPRPDRFRPAACGSNPSASNSGKVSRVPRRRVDRHQRHHAETRWSRCCK